jgi:putative molybdopterin biosynthesis protein
VRVRLLAPDATAVAQERVLISGCAPGLGLLALHLQRRPGGLQASWIHATTDAALAQLAHGETHVAGVHFAGQAGAPAGDQTRAGRGRRRQQIITFARWQQGLLVRRGDRRAPRTIEQLGRKDVCVARRESGASAGRLLDDRLSAAGVRLQGRRLDVRGHFGVAQAVAIGAADVGVAAEPAAVAHDLDFVPLDEERFDLIFDQQTLPDGAGAQLGDVLTSRAFRDDLASLGGYDTSSTGRAIEAGAGR